MFSPWDCRENAYDAFRRETSALQDLINLGLLPINNKHLLCASPVSSSIPGTRTSDQRPKEYEIWSHLQGAQKITVLKLEQ